MDILIVAGEASGDTLGAGFVQEFKKRKPNSRFFGLGGDKMKSSGVDIIYHIKDLAFLGFWEVIKNIRFIKKVQSDIFKKVEEFKPSLAVLIDYPGFNLRLAPKLKARGVKVFYYVSPQIWAWGAGRIKKIKKNVDHMAVVFGFEKELYEKAGVPVTFVGHPLIDEIQISLTGDEFAKLCNLRRDEIPIGLFPGSRLQEVKRILPEMLYGLELAFIGYPKIVGIIGKAPTLDSSVYEEIIEQCHARAVIYQGNNYELMAHSKLNLVCSGTATLECGIIGVPMIVMYKTSPITYHIARRLVRIPNIGMVNVVAGKKVVPELIQGDCVGNKIAEQLLHFLNDDTCYNSVKEELSSIKTKLGEPGASSRAAEVAIDLLQQSN